MKFFAVILSLLSLTLCSCVSDHAERIYTSLPPSTTPAEMLSAIPQRPYDLVADIQWEGGSTKKMVTRATQLGGDAVIVQLLGGNVDLRNRSPEEMNRTSTTFNRMVGTVIKYKK